MRSEQFSQCDLLFVQQQLCCTFGHKIAPKGVSPGLMISAAASASINDSAVGVSRKEAVMQPVNIL